MEWLRNLPFFCIFLAMAAAILVSVIPRQRACYWLTVAVSLAVMLMSAVLLVWVVKGEWSFTFTMGKFPAPFGNEIKAGPLQALFATGFSAILALILLGGKTDFFEDVSPKKIGLVCAMLNMTLASLLVLIYTNDMFTAYVFIEISTIAACALAMAKDRGAALIATTRYLFMSLLGSGMFLLSLVLLYSVTGHLLMPQISAAVQVLAQSGEYRLIILVALGLMVAGLGIKGAMFPFHRWLPDAHGGATTAASAVLSGLVLKGYAILMTILFIRVFTLDVIRALRVNQVVFVLGLLGMIVGSLDAIRQVHIKRMLAYSSVAQMGYVFMGIGVGSELGIDAACFHILVHACSKPLLFLCAGRLSAVCGHKKYFQDLIGSAHVAPVAGVGFTVGALSMIGIPLFAGFTSKLNFASAFVQHGEEMVLVLVALALSTVLKALYYIPALAAIWSRHGHHDEERIDRAPRDRAFSLAAILLMAGVFFLGIRSGAVQDIIQQGLTLL